MKKRHLRDEVKVVLAGLMVIACVFVFSGCSKTSDETVDNTQIPNPWTEVETIDEALNKAGYANFDLPESIDGKEITYIAVLNNEFPEVEVIYGDDVTIRKAPTDGDISGDYNEYKLNENHDGEDISFTVKGNDGTTWNNITWTSGEYSYSITSTSGLSIETVNQLVSIIK